MPKTDVMRLRLEPEENEAFTLAARLSGQSVSAWTRFHLRRAATQALEAAGRRVAFAKAKRKAG